MNCPVIPTKTPGVYAITCTPTQKVYVGSSKDVRCRYWQHLGQLVKGKHFNSYLQAAWSKYGGENFSYIVLEVTAESALIEREQHWIDTLETPTLGFNLCPNAEGTRGFTQPREAVIQRAEASRGKKHVWSSPEARDSFINSVRARERPSDEMCAAQGARMMAARLADPEGYKVKLSAGRKGIPVPEERKARQSATMKAKGIQRTEAEKKNLSDKLTGNKKSPETIAKMRIAAAARVAKRRASVVDNGVQPPLGQDVTRPGQQAVEVGIQDVGSGMILSAAD